MRLVVDANIPLAQEAFSSFGEVVLLPGREITKADLAGAGALVVRSVTRIGADLLDGTPVRFVGTATIGTDHLDIPWLEQHGIAWASAAGCNARSVVEWVLAALAEYCVANRMEWRGRTLGIVGHGNIGSRLAVVARALGMRVLVCDPPLARAGRMLHHVPIDDLVPECDFLTFHVPLIRTGQDATVHLMNGDRLDLMKPGAALLNSSRGVVLDNAAARAYAMSEAQVFLLDVFEGEPAPNRDLVRYSLLSTPHIAGYSWEGKVNGTRMMAEALGRFLRKPCTWEPRLDPPESPVCRLTSRRPMLAIAEAIRASYDIQADNNRLREGLPLEDDAAWGAHFDALRKYYPRRREFANYRIEAPGADESLLADLAAMGFRVH